MLSIHDELLDYVAKIVHEIKEDISAGRYAEATAKVDAVADLLNSLNESQVS